MSIDYSERIPNNVDLAGDKTLQRALERWQPGFAGWWGEMGPDGSAGYDVYLRTAVSVDRDGWANFGYVRMPEYRWGIFLNPPEPGRVIGFGDHKGEPAWQEVPGEYRANLRRIIVTQGDTEPASVEQQRRLGLTCPSLYDLRNLFQINCEEGRHLWAMVYLLHRYFGRDGREEAEALLERRSGDRDNGKFQLTALAESGFDPLARTTRFMLTEEAHHMYVGVTGITRILQRTAEVMAQERTDDPARLRALGVIDLPTMQRYLNFHYSVTLDLFGADMSSNAATFYTTGLKGRFDEARIADDHLLKDRSYPVPDVSGGRLTEREAPALNALNEKLRDDYIEDTMAGVARWNRVLAKNGVDFQIRLPHKGFNRRIGSFAGVPISPDGEVLSREAWEANTSRWLPTAEDRAYVQSLMGRVVEPGKFANWIAPPERGINNQPLDFEYVRFG
jgi:benzoyl-CoA 2,3-dioxygenase component B